MLSHRSLVTHSIYDRKKVGQGRQTTYTITPPPLIVRIFWRVFSMAVQKGGRRGSSTLLKIKIFSRRPLIFSVLISMYCPSPENKIVQRCCITITLVDTSVWLQISTWLQTTTWLITVNNSYIKSNLVQFILGIAYIYYVLLPNSHNTRNIAHKI